MYVFFVFQVSLSGVGHPIIPKGAELLQSQPEVVMPNTALLVKNPLASTHVFKQACHLCYPKTGDVLVTPAAVVCLGIVFLLADQVLLSHRPQGW